MDHIREYIDRHQRWLESNGAEGKRLDLAAEGLADIDWARTILVEVDLREATLVGARLAHADLFGSVLAGCRLDRAELDGANLAKANLDEASLIGAGLRGTTLTRATLARADLRGADLTGANLLKTFLHKADLRGAILIGDLERVSLTGARLAGVRLSGATGIESAIVEWIDVGADVPQRLDGAAALAWLRERTD